MKLLLIGAISNSEATYKDGIRKRFGGGVMYGGRAAAKLGIDTTVITIGADDIEGGISELQNLGLKVERIRRNFSNNFSNDYTGNTRTLRVRSIIEEPINPSEITISPDLYDAVIIYSQFKEITPALLKLFNPEKVLLDPQGLVRKLGNKDINGLFSVDHVDWEDKEKFSSLVRFLKISDEDLENLSFIPGVEDKEKKCSKLVEMGFKVVIHTRGKSSTVIYQPGKEGDYIPVENVEVKDHAGAGEIFAVGFMYRYNKTKDIADAVTFANKFAGLLISNSAYNLSNIEESLGN